MQNFKIRNIIVLAIFTGGLLAAYMQSAQRIALPQSQSDTNQFNYVIDLDFWQRTDREQRVKTAVRFDLASNLNEMPLEMGNWRGETIPETNQEVFILLEPEQYVRRLYQDQAGHQLGLTLIGGRNSRSFHPLDLCYEADGWKTTLSSKTIALGNDQEINGLWLQAQKPLTATNSVIEDMVFYFFIFPDGQRNLADGLVLFKIATPRYGSIEETLAVQGDFLRRIFSHAEPVKSL